MAIRVEQLDASDEWTIRRMRALRDRVYEGDDHYCAPFEESFERQLRRPQFAKRQQAFMVRRTGEDVGCAVVRRSEVMELNHRPVATIGNFEALHDPEATHQLFRRAVQWARSQGSEEVIGPMNGDTWYGFRCNLGPWDEHPFFMEPYNPSYYPELFGQAGFEMLQTYRSLRIDDIEGAARYHQPRWAKARAMGYRVEPMAQVGSDEALDRIYELICVTFARNYLFTSIRRPTFKKLYDGFESIVTDSLSLFLVDDRGEDVGFAMAFPDYGRAVAAMEGRRGPRARLRFMLNRNTDTANIKTFAVIPEHRGRGLSSAMAHHYYTAMADEGYRRANLCLVHDDNISSQKMDAGRGRILRRYALYRYPLDS